MPHLSELHGAATHLAVVAILLYVIVLLFARSGLGCASCHGDQAQGLRGPALAGGAELEEFRHVHGKGLFPPDVVTDRDFAAINAWLRTLQRRGRD